MRQIQRRMLRRYVNFHPQREELHLLSIGDKESRRSRFALSPWNEAAGGEVGSGFAKGESKCRRGEGTLEEATELIQERVLFWHAGGEQATSFLREVGERVVAAK